LEASEEMREEMRRARLVMQADAYEVEKARDKRLAESTLFEALDQKHNLSSDQFGLSLRRRHLGM
jgi:hypothetical protein